MELRWYQNKLLGFDLETTGVDTHNDRVVTSAITELTPPATPGRWEINNHHWLVNPGIDIPPGATNVHGITTEHAREHGTDPALAIAQIIETLAALTILPEYLGPTSRVVPIVGMNLTYDFTLLHHEALRHGVTTWEQRQANAGVRVPIIDVYVLDKHYDPRRKGKRTLTDLCAQYAVPLEDAHTAHGDVLGACRVAHRLGSLTEAGGIDPNQLHTLQIRWREQQCASLETYFRKIRKPGPDGHPIHIDRCWPVCTDPNHPHG